MGNDLYKELIGREIAGKFKIDYCVGIGGAGSVYAAEQISLGRTVALKVLNPDLASNPKTIRRFHDEALAASRLNHPNTVSVIDYGHTDDGLLYLVMEYVAGKTLTQLVEEDFPVPVPRVLDIVSQILLGMEEAHASGIVHADIKGDNVIVEHRRGGWDLVKVVDFGIARIIGENEEEGAKKTICGTPEYMAPELVRGTPPDVATDLYALGIVLYELLVGNTPFVGGTTIDVLRRQVRSDIPKLSEHAELPIPDSLEEILNKVLAKEPGERFVSATEMREAILACKNSLSEPTEQTILCRGCGIFVDESFRFCPECGTPGASVVVENVKRQESEKPIASTSEEPSMALDDFDGVWPLPFVGRDPQLKEVLETLTASIDKDNLLIFGKPGMGRTRLLSASYGALRGKGIVYQTSPDPTRLKRYGYPINALLSSVMALPSPCTQSDVTAITDRLGLAEKHIRGVLDCLGLVADEDFATPEKRRYEAAQGGIAILKEIADRGNSVFVFEDVDRFDDFSMYFLSELAAAGTVPLIASSSKVETLQGTRRVTLDSLQEEDISKIYAHLETKNVDYVDSAAQLHELSGGSPKAIHHLIRFANEGGDLGGAPKRLPDLISARVAMLPHDALLAVQLAAVLGHECLVDDLFACAEAIRIHEGLDVALDLLAARDYLYEQNELIGFSDPLVREIIVAMIPADVRRMLNSTIAGHLYQEGADPLLAGYHHHFGGNHRSAVMLLLNGSESIFDKGDFEQAIQYEKLALASARNLAVNDEDEGDIFFLHASLRLARSLAKNGEHRLASGLLVEAEQYATELPLLRGLLLLAQANIMKESGAASQSQYQKAGELLQQFRGTQSVVDAFVQSAAFALEKSALGKVEESLRIAEKVIATDTDGSVETSRFHTMKALMYAKRNSAADAQKSLVTALEASSTAEAAAQVCSVAIGISSDDEIWLDALQQRIGVAVSRKELRAIKSNLFSMRALKEVVSLERRRKK